MAAFSKLRQDLATADRHIAEAQARDAPSLRRRRVPGRCGMTYRQLLWACLVAGFIAGYTTHRSSWQEPATLAEIYARQILAAMEPE